MVFCHPQLFKFKYLYIIVNVSSDLLNLLLYQYLRLLPYAYNWDLFSPIIFCFYCVVPILFPVIKMIGIVLIALIATLAPIQILSTSQNFPITPFLNSDVSPIRTIDDVFARLPSLKQLDELVLNGDSVAILKTIQIIASQNQLRCEDKLAYLSEIEGRMKSAIFKKKLQADKLQTIIYAFEQEISRLKLQNQRLETSIILLFLDQLQSSIDRKVQQLEQLYLKYNELPKQPYPQSETLKRLQSTLKSLQQASESDRIRLKNLTIQIAKVQSRASAFRNNPAIINQIKVPLLQEKQQIEERLQKNYQLILQIKNEIRDTQRSLQLMEKQINTTKIRYLKLQIQLEKEREQLFSGKLLEKQARQKIKQNNDQINHYTTKLRYPQLIDLRHIVSSLNDRFPGLQNQINRQYYLCYTESNDIQETIQNTIVVYLMNGSQFTVYLNNVYSYQIDQYSQEQLALYPIDIFSEIWSHEFGTPFGIQQSLEEDPDSELTIINDFYCLTPTQTVSGFGRIEKVTNRTIVIEDSTDGKLLLVLGSCTRLQCSNCVDQMIEVGKRIIWRGLRHPNVPEFIQLYTGTII